MESFISPSLSGSFGNTEDWLIVGEKGVVFDKAGAGVVVGYVEDAVVGANVIVLYIKSCDQPLSSGSYRFAVFSAFGVKNALGFHNTSWYSHATVFVVAFGLTKGHDVVFPAFRAMPYSVYGQLYGTWARYSVGIRLPYVRVLSHQNDVGLGPPGLLVPLGVVVGWFIPGVGVNMSRSDTTTAVICDGTLSIEIGALVTVINDNRWSSRT
jgi:hypothetical protein